MKTVSRRVICVFVAVVVLLANMPAQAPLNALKKTDATDLSVLSDALSPSVIPSSDHIRVSTALSSSPAIVPTGAGPHAILATTQPGFLFTPDRFSVQQPGEDVTYIHVLHNTGNISDTYTLTWSRSHSWSTISAALNGAPVTVPGTATLLTDQTLLITVTVSVPTDAVTGTVDTIIITATSSVSPTLAGRVTDFTLVPRSSDVASAVIHFVCCAYTPSEVVIQPGESVEWDGDFGSHPLVSDDGGLDQSGLTPPA